MKRFIDTKIITNNHEDDILPKPKNVMVMLNEKSCGQQGQ